MHLLSILLIFVLHTTLGSGDLFAAKLYKWTDAEGVLTYSPTPPSKETTTEFEEINLGGSINIEPVKKSEKEYTIDSNPTPTDQTEPFPVNADSVRKRRNCLDLNKQIAVLEIRLTNAEGPEELNNTMLLIGKYQQNLEKTCKFSR